MTSENLIQAAAPEQSCGECTDFLSAALCWYGYGFPVIPVIPGTKQTAVRWDLWLDNLSIAAIRSYWGKHPDHELGFIASDEFIVFDADTPQSVAALHLIEKTFDLAPSLIIETAKGQHHFFRRASGTYAKSDSHSTEKHPDRIDVKTGRALVVLPPSTGKTVLIDEVRDVD